jgi:hypothetical protein
VLLVVSKFTTGCQLAKSDEASSKTQPVECGRMLNSTDCGICEDEWRMTSGACPKAVTPAKLTIASTQEAARFLCGVIAG